jgi:outer membrane receptor protein involved in Fe transport
MRPGYLTALCAGASVLAIGASAHAQTASSSKAANANASSQAGSVTEVVVTGTRLRSNGYTQPTPVTVAPTEELLKVTPTNIADALNNLPQFVNSSSPARSTHNFTNSALNGNILNLRGVGGNKTLILLDGERMPPTTYLGAVDVDVLPNLLVSRVDIVTGGASSVYGSDAVAGVVNYVLDHNFTGVKGEFSGGVSQKGDNSNYKVGIALGSKLFNDRGHVLFSFEDYNNDGMLRSDRDAATHNYIFAGAVPGSLAQPGTAANPWKLYQNANIGIASPTGAMLFGPLAGQQFTVGGTGLMPFNPGTPTGTPGYYYNGVNHSGLQIPANNTAIAPLDTKKVFGRLSFDFTPDVTGYVQGNYTRSALSYTLEANGFLPIPLFSGNPYLPAAAQSAMTAAGAPSISVFQYPFGPNPHTTEVTDFYTIGAGLDGRFRGWDWNLHYNHAHSTDDVDQGQTLMWQHAYAAVDAVVNPANGHIVCNPSLSADPAIAARYASCQPLNIFNPYSTPGGLAYALGTSSFQATVTQDDVAGSISGHPFSLPAGPVLFAAGGEYRHESLLLTSNSNPALLDTPAEQAAYFAGLRGVPPGTLAFWLTNVGVADASEDVKEGFGEIDVPIVKDLPLMESLHLSAAGRVTDYSTSGTVETWKLGATWRVSQDFQLRVVRSRDIRAPNLYELFAGAQSGIGQVTDPVTHTTANLSTISAGNPNLKPEDGDTFTVGGVITPRVLPGFSASIDYYQLKISNAIQTLSAQDVLNNCTINGIAEACALITRPSPTSFPTLIHSGPVNTVELKTNGIDFDVTYHRHVGDGDLSTRLYANYLLSFFTEFDGGVYDLAGYASPANQPIAYPRLRGELSVDYRYHAWDFFVNEQYIGSYSLNVPLPAGVVNTNVYENPNVGAEWYTNLTVSYTLPIKNAKVDTFLTVNNLFDQDPPLIPGAIPGENLPTIISLYDTVGRSFTMGVRFKF